MKIIKVKNISIGEGKTKVAVSISGKSKEEILDIAKKIDIEKVDMVEWRGDFFKDIFHMDKVLEVLELLRQALNNTPIIFTFRSKKEGGEREISEDDYYYLNKEVGKSKLVDLIDVEIFSKEDRVKELMEFIKKQNIFVIGSSHDFLKTPSEEKMILKLKKLEDLGADILKLAVMPNEPKDVLSLLNISNEMKNHSNKPVITISMGSLGMVSRICGNTFGSSVSFGSLDKKSAPGQIPVDELYKILRLDF